MTDPLAHLAFILAAWVLCFALRFKASEVILSLGGLIFLALYAPLAAGWILFTCAEGILLFLWLRNRARDDGLKKYGAYVLLLNLLAVDIHPLVFGFNVETLAISFSTIRIFMTSKQLLSARKAPALSDTGWVLVSGFYLPAILIGPVFSGLDLKKQKAASERYEATITDHRLVLQGLVLAILGNPAMGSIAATMTSEDGYGLPAIAAAPLLFLQLFTAFWGQSLIAEHTSRYFGYVLPVNFDMPWRAKDIRDFWQRWHRSMAQFVMQYIFLPLNLKGWSPKAATIAAFVFMGLWHNLSIGYFIWGLGHGILLANWPKKELVGARLYLGAAFTWVCVIGLSYVANFGELAQ
ncbi:MBOAT family O-acyltransferase [Altererythrobacter sp. MF3-039]|uniref:MBOAT family O-acyltransferase n=1 Tax=Altererythrobacter sp. MF3-039 TaxID=3252901 RepID=UPI00390C664F